MHTSGHIASFLLVCFLAEGIEIKISDELISQPYVDMTVKLMERFGLKVRRAEPWCPVQR